jgi:type II secretory pathway component GspD/PulD (secretin)
VSANEIVTALRNALGPDASVFLVSGKNAIVARLTPEDDALVQKLLTELDLPQKAYLLSYTLTEMDGTKVLGTHRYSMATVSGMNLKLKQGDKVPIVTGFYSAVATQDKPAGQQTQVTYLDTGINFDSTLTGTSKTGVLKADIVQSNIAPQAFGLGPSDPMVHQTELAGNFLLTPGKPTKLGSLDLPGTTHHLEVEATIEPLN